MTNKTNELHLAANRLRQDLARAVRLIRRGQADDRVVFRDKDGGLIVRVAGLATTEEGRGGRD